jgi:hypothetical protein
MLYDQQLDSGTIQSGSHLSIAAPVTLCELHQDFIIILKAVVADGDNPAFACRLDCTQVRKKILGKRCNTALPRRVSTQKAISIDLSEIKFLTPYVFQPRQYHQPSKKTQAKISVFVIFLLLLCHLTLSFLLKAVLLCTVLLSAKESEAATTPSILAQTPIFT